MKLKCFICCLLAFFCTSEADPSVRLVKKRIHDGLKFSRTIKYTNESITTTHNSHNSNRTQELSLDVLLVADFSTYQAFLEMTNGDPVGAQHYLNSYLTAVFDQAKLIYDKIKFGDAVLKLSFAGTFTAFREEDCPLWLSWEESEEEIAKKLDESDKELDLNSTIIDIDQDFEDSNSTLFNESDTDNSTTKINTDNIKIHKKLRHFVDTTLDQLQEANNTEMSLRIDSKKAIDLFTTWIKQYADFLPKHEHAVLITKFDLVSINGHSATQGMAYVGNVCQLGESSSVVEDIGGSLTALIAAHEIGHSLGALHDGAMEAAECDSSENYLLAVAVSGSTNRKSFLNSRQMSNCSINSIIENLKKPSASCIKKWKSKDQRNSTSDFSKKPGESISVMQQCQISFGPTFGSCLNPGYYHGKSICERLWCSDRKVGSSDACQTLNYFPAFDGTTCGYKMWCIEGECVRNPKKWMDCKDMNSKTCSKYSESKLKHFCKSKDFREVCCRTCAKKGKVVAVE